MKKFIILAVVLLMCLSSCGDKYENAVIDIGALADSIMNSVVFDDQLVPISESVMKTAYNFGEYTNMIVYTGSGATAEEVILIECADAAAADKIYMSVDTYYKNKKFYFKDYNPEEMYKLDDPIFTRIGKYVIYCVSPDTAEVQRLLNTEIT